MISIVPTFRWLTAVMVSFSVLFAAINYQRNTIYWLAYITLGFLLFGTLYTLKVRRGMRWTWNLPSFLYYKDFSSRVANPLYEFNSKMFPKIDPAQFNTVGYHHLPNTSYYTEYPLGLFRIKINVPEYHFWVYPDPVNHQETQVMNEKNSDISGVTNYTAGQSPKRILKRTQNLPPSHWRILDNSDALSQKRTVSLIDWDSLPANWTTRQKIEHLVYILDKLPNDQLFSLHLPNFNIKDVSGEDNRHQALQALTTLWKNSVL